MAKLKDRFETQATCTGGAEFKINVSLDRVRKEQSLGLHDCIAVDQFHFTDDEPENAACIRLTKNS